MRWLVVLCLLACGPVPDYQSRAGVAYFWETSSWQPDLIEEQEAWFLEGLSRFPRFTRAEIQSGFNRTSVSVFKDPIGNNNGVLIRPYTAYVRDMGCPFNSALTHELAHMLDEQQGLYDLEHVDQDLWRLADSAPRACPEPQSLIPGD